MNPASNEAAGPQLPTPEQALDLGAAGISVPGERAPAGGEKAPATGQAAPPMAMPAMSLPLPPALAQTIPQNDVPAASPAPAPAVVDDGDLIEKEWVHKAKQIVEANRDDPYKQSEELTVFKADYMKKRYDKNIKLSK